MNAIEVQNLHKHFGKVDVLKGVTLSVARGEIFTLLGENGAGKSTLINILATLSRADEGSVQILGLDPLTAGNQVRQCISLNAQTMTLDESFSGIDNLRLIAALRNIPAPDAAINALAERLGMTSFLQRQVKTYSGGMKRRLDIALSLLGDPEIIFLDEPTTGVDPKNRLALWRIIRELRDGGKTVFLTTQYLDEADALSDHMAFIADGRIVKFGTPAQIKRQVRATATVEVASSAQTAATEALTAAQLPFTRAAARFTFAQAVAARGLATLLASGVTIKRYQQDEADLESVFLAVTQEEVNHDVA
jgi:ABC-2 type transport system ATP-binding protein